VGKDAGMTDDVSKFSKAIKRASSVCIVIAPIFGVVVFLWLRFGIPLIFFVNNYRNISYYGAGVLVIGYALAIIKSTFAMLGMILDKNITYSKFNILGVVIFIFTIPLCCLGSLLSLQTPTVMDTVNINEHTFFLTGELEFLDSHAYSRLYKCNKATYQCEQTIFFDGGGGAGFRPLHLMIDKLHNPNEVNVIYTEYDSSERLEFTYGAQPRYYDYPVQLNDHLYYLAHYRYTEYRPVSTTFVLYECELDNTSCKQLPIQYEGFGRLRDTTVDETTGEINVFIDNQINQDTLIFTWGEQPRCYVKGCEILDETK
jgi:hypothetical protein